MEESSSRPLANLLLLLASVIVALLLLEGGLRVLESMRARAQGQAPSAVAGAQSADSANPAGSDGATPEYVPSELLGWTLRPSAVQRFRRDGFDTTVRSNGLGFRGGEVEPKAAGVFRYAVLGDSYAFGWGVEEEETYGAQLESLLTANHVEVVNGALPGFGTYQRLAALERLRPYGLDGVIIDFSAANDVIDDWRARPYVPDRLGDYQVRGTQFTAIERFLTRRSRLARLALDRAMPLRLWVEGRRPINLARTRRLWETILDRAAILGLPVVVVVNPSRTQVANEGKLVRWLAHTSYGRRPNAMMRDLISRRGLTAVDGEAVFGAAPAAELYLGGDAHWTPAGHRRLAEGLARAVSAALADRKRD